MSWKFYLTLAVSPLIALRDNSIIHVTFVDCSLPGPKLKRLKETSTELIDDNLKSRNY